MEAITASVGKGGANRQPDVKTIQSLLNRNLHLLVPLAPQPVNGLANALLFAAITEFQRRVLRMHSPDGRVDPNGRTLGALNSNAAVSAPSPATPPWLAIARLQKGTQEIRGAGSNSTKVLACIATFPYLKDIWHDPKKKDYKLADADETPWCACFVNWCLIQAGMPRGPSARAKDWMAYGTGLDQPRPGAICVVYRTPKTLSSGVTSSGYHVAFWTGGSGNSLTLLGGNQTAADGSTEEVNEKSSTGYWTVKAYRWPT